MDDLELLERYRRGGEEEAFAELVRRHGEWIYPSARRQLGDDHLAEDAAQGVFLLLARKAGRLSAKSNLGAWLFGTLRFCINEARRQRSRQRHYEKEAAQMRPERLPEAGWEEISPLLDDAVATLGKADRDAVLMRFFQGMSFAEVGKASGVGEEAARKRVERAVGKLREKLAGKGVEVEAGSLGAMVLAHALEGGGPAGLVEKVMAGIGGGGGNGTAGLIAKGALKMMTIAKVKVAAVVVIIVAAAVGGSVAVVAQTSATRTSGQDTGKVNPGIIVADNPGEIGEYYIGGDVARIGVYSLTARQITLKQALVSAGANLNSLRGYQIDLIRRLPDNHERRITVDVDSLFAGSQPDRFLQPNDVIQVHAAASATAAANVSTKSGGITKPEVDTRKINLGIIAADNPGDGEYLVSGDVARVGSYSLTARQITLKQALVSAGMNINVVKGYQIDLIRRLSDDQERRITVDVDSLLADTQPDRFLQPNDVIQVRAGAPSTAPAIPR